jgi:hypothetical protein
MVIALTTWTREDCLRHHLVAQQPAQWERGARYVPGGYRIHRLSGYVYRPGNCLPDQLTKGRSREPCPGV